MLLELDPPNFKEDSFNPRATQVQKLEILPPALDYFLKNTYGGEVLKD